MTTATKPSKNSKTKAKRKPRPYKLECEKLVITDVHGNERIVLGVDPDGVARVTLKDPWGNDRIQLAVRGDLTWVIIGDQTGCHANIWAEDEYAFIQASSPDLEVGSTVGFRADDDHHAEQYFTVAGKTYLTTGINRQCLDMVLRQNAIEEAEYQASRKAKGGAS